MDSLLILGRQPALGIAELESLYGSNHVTAISNAAIVGLKPEQIAFDRLGAAVKLCRIIANFNSTDWSVIEQSLPDQVLQLCLKMPPGKIILGISSYGLTDRPAAVQKTGHRLKKILAENGRNVRIIPNRQTFLSSAQVFHNRLTGQKTCELVLIKHRDSTILAQTVRVQNINAYARRDQQRPARDPKVGMLPPKLAQIIINLATGLLTSEKTKLTLLDPFCGTGVVLQEAALMGYDCVGSDINPRMIDYTQQNLAWLRAQPSLLKQPVDIHLEPGDATSHLWSIRPDFIASETYLGLPLIGNQNPVNLKPMIAEVNQLIETFLRNLAPQIKSGTRLCLAIPAWPLGNHNWQHLPFLDSLETIGYNRCSFQHVSQDQLIYYRPGQSVARELLVLMKV